MHDMTLIVLLTAAPVVAPILRYGMLTRGGIVLCIRMSDERCLLCKGPRLAVHTLHYDHGFVHSALILGETQKDDRNACEQEASIQSTGRYSAGFLAYDVHISIHGCNWKSTFTATTWSDTGGRFELG